MTAAQRNCVIAIEECLRRYSLDDVLFAVQHAVESIKAESEEERRRLVRISWHLTEARDP